MDRKMETRPPALIEEIVRVLTPPACREHVLGDLSERYASPRSYILDALRTLPFVVMSRIRRTIDPAMFLVGVLLIWGLVFWSPAQPTWMAGVIPTVVASVVLALRDAYRPLAPKAWRVVSLDMVYLVAAVAVSQAILAVLAPQWMLSLESPVTDYGIGLIILVLARLQVPTGLIAHKPATGSISMSELTTEIRIYESAIRRAIGIEMAACVVVIFAFLGGLVALEVQNMLASELSLPGVPVHGIVEKAAMILVVGAALFVGVFLYRYCRVRPIPLDLGFERAVAAYREDLEYRCKLSATYVWWYLLPLMLGPTLFTISAGLSSPAPYAVIGIGLLTFAIVGALLIWVQKRMIRRTRGRIRQLSVATEKI